MDAGVFQLPSNTCQKNLDFLPGPTEAVFLPRSCKSSKADRAKTGKAILQGPDTFIYVSRRPFPTT